MTHHLESGSCADARGLNRDQIYRFVRSKDPRGTISKNLIGWTGSDKYEATDYAWNGDWWECYFCHRCFNSRSALNQHLNSPIRKYQGIKKRQDMMKKTCDLLTGGFSEGDRPASAVSLSQRRVSNGL